MEKKKYLVYLNDKSSTAERRKNLHTELLSEIKQRMNKLVESAPEANKEKMNTMFDVALSMIGCYGHSTLFYNFASEQVSDKDFVTRIQQVLNYEF